MVKQIELLGEWLVARVIRFRWLSILSMLLLTLAAVPGMKLLTVSNEYRVFFGPDNPQLLAFDNIEQQYSKLDNFFFVVQPPNKDIFSAESYPIVQRVTELAWYLPYVNRVDSVSNFQHTRADGDDLVVLNLLEEGVDYTQTELDEKRRVALADPGLSGFLISDDASTAGVNATATLNTGEPDTLAKTMVAARALVKQVEREFPGTIVAISGTSPMSNAFAEAAQRDVSTLIPAMYMVLLLAMLIIFRSLAATLITFMVLSCATVMAMGVAGYLGIELTPMSLNAPIVIMTLAVADSVHILMTFLSQMRRGKNKLQALREAMRINFVAVAITSVTTMIGFGSLNFSDAPPFHDLGNISVLGIFAAWMLSVILLPALVAVLPLKTAKGGGREKPQLSVRLMQAWADFCVRHSRKILIAFVPLTLGLLAVIPTLNLNDPFVQFFDESLEFRRDTEFMFDHLTGVYTLDYDMRSGSEQGITNPEYLEYLDDFALWLREQPEVLSVYSFSDVIKALNRSMHSDDNTWYRIPQDPELAAQYLLLYELSLPYGLDLADRIKFDKSGSRLTVVVADMGSRELRNFSNKTLQWLQLNSPANMQGDVAGAALMFSYMSQRNIESMVTGNLIAVASIAVILIIALQSVGLGLLSLVPNLLPILFALGSWTLLVGVAGTSTAIVGACSLGIVVDNTVHFLSKYTRARREFGNTRAAAISYTFDTVGMALVANAIILVGGFSMLALSFFYPNFEMGVLTAITIALALFIDLLLLPALLLAGPERRS